MSKKVKSMVTICIIGFLIIIMPLIISIGVSLPILENIIVDNDWIGFWGSYTGSVLGGIITLYVLWSTIKDNEQARQRDEKIQFFDKIIKIYAELNASIGNTFAYATRALDTYDNILYKDYLDQLNYSAGLANELGMLLASRRQVYCYEEFDRQFFDLTKKVNEFTHKFENDFFNRNVEKDDDDGTKKFENDMDEILKVMAKINQTLATCVKDNLEKV